MDFNLPEDLRQYLAELDEFIEREIKPLEQQDDNIRFFDQRREDARTDWDRGGLPSRDWEALLAAARRRADAAGHYRYAFPKEYGGRDGTNNFVANRLCCDAADRAMQVHGGLGYSRHQPFEHIYRHHRRYRITEGAEEIQMRRVAGYLFGYMKQQAPKGVPETLAD